MALYGSALNQSLSNARCSLRHLGLCLGCLTFCSYPMQNISALNKLGNTNPLSHTRCSLRHLGLGLGCQPFCANPMEKIESVANPPLDRVPQREMVYPPGSKSEALQLGFHLILLYFIKPRAPKGGRARSASFELEREDNCNVIS